MFTGIIQEIGTVMRLARAGDVARLTVAAPHISRGLGLGESVAVNGVCLSVVRLRQGLLEFEMVPETQRLTTLGRLRSGSRVNVEPSLRLCDRLNGHLVLGHVDGTGRITRLRRRGEHVVMALRMPPALSRYCVAKGPIAVDGVSLTIGSRRSGTDLEIYLIPDTLRKTIFGERRVGDAVNLEVDYLAKLIRITKAQAA
jgi:riboflavin synthase